MRYMPEDKYAESVERWGFGWNSYLKGATLVPSTATVVIETGGATDEETDGVVVTEVDNDEGVMSFLIAGGVPGKRVVLRLQVETTDGQHPVEKISYTTR